MSDDLSVKAIRRRFDSYANDLTDAFDDLGDAILNNCSKEQRDKLREPLNRAYREALKARR